MGRKKIISTCRCKKRESNVFRSTSKFHLVLTTRNKAHRSGYGPVPYQRYIYTSGNCSGVLSDYTESNYVFERHVCREAPANQNCTCQNLFCFNEGNIFVVTNMKHLEQRGRESGCYFCKGISFIFLGLMRK